MTGRRRDVVWIVLLIGAIFVADIQLPLGVAGGILYVVPVLFSMWLLSSTATFLVTGVSAVLTVLGLLVSPPGIEPTWMVLVNRAYSLIAFGLMGGVHYLHEKVMEKNRRMVSKTAALEALLEIGTALQGLFDVQTIKEAAVERARALFEADLAGLALARGEHAIEWEILNGSRAERPVLAIDECVGGVVIRSGEPLIIEDAATDAVRGRAQLPLIADEGLEAVLAVPVRVAGRPRGVLMVGHRRPSSFDLGDLRLLVGLANQISIAIDNANLHEQMRGLSALEERQQIACELHDGLAQRLGHITARSTAAAELLRQGKIAAASEQLDRLRVVSEDASVSVRESIDELRKASSLDYQFLRRPQDVARWVADEEGIELALDTSGVDDGAELSPAVEVQLMRILQESFRNIKKHTGHADALVRIEERDGEIGIAISDRGPGFAVAELQNVSDHYGVRMMRERAEAVGGRFEITSTTVGGSTVAVCLPAARRGSR